MLRKVLTWAGIAFILFMVAFKPDQSLQAVRVLAGVASDIFDGVGSFFSGLVSGS